MTDYTEGDCIGDLVKFEEDHRFSRSIVNLKSSTETTAQPAASFGMVLGMITASGLYRKYNQDGADGTEVAAAVALQDVDPIVGSGNPEILVIKREAIVSDKSLVWPSDITANEKAAAIADLEAIGIIVREEA